MAAPTAAAVLPTRGVLELSGADARTFLQGLVTADLGRLAPDRAIWAALLTAQGRCLADFALVEDGPRILLDVERAALEALARRLALYRLRAAVTIEDRSAAWTVLAVPDPAAVHRFGLPAEHGACRRLDGALVFVDPRLAALGVRALVPSERLAPFLAAHGLREADAAPWDRHRLALGVPEGAVDLPPEKALAVESGFLELDIVSLTKGCFVGQELTARMAHRGLAKRRLVPVRVEGPLPEPGTTVRLDGREVGEVRSGRDDRALALLRLEALSAGPLEADGAWLWPELPGWMELGGKSLT
jgi:folate-binding protein YgfZ